MHPDADHFTPFQHSHLDSSHYHLSLGKLNKLLTAFGISGDSWNIQKVWGALGRDTELKISLKNLRRTFSQNVYLGFRREMKIKRFRMWQVKNIPQKKTPKHQISKPLSMIASNAKFQIYRKSVMSSYERRSYVQVTFHFPGMMNLSCKKDALIIHLQGTDSRQLA
jgi:hypothetical protein